MADSILGAPELHELLYLGKFSRKRASTVGKTDVAVDARSMVRRRN